MEQIMLASAIMKKKNCWEFKKCGREQGGRKASELGVCPAAVFNRLDGIHGGRNAGRACWVVAGTLCKEKPQGTFAQKYKDCGQCSFYRTVIEEEKDFMPTIAILKKMEEGILVETLRMAIEKKQELYKLFTDLAEKPIDEESREILGHLAYEEFVHLNALLERYRNLVDETHNRSV